MAVYSRRTQAILWRINLLYVYLACLWSIQKQAANQHHPSLLSIICALPRCDTLCRSSTPMACVIDTILTVTMLFSIRGMTCMVIGGYGLLDLLLLPSILSRPVSLARSLIRSTRFCPPRAFDYLLALNPSTRTSLLFVNERL